MNNNNEIKNESAIIADDLLSLIKAELDKNGLADEHIKSFNRLLTSIGIKSIITTGFSIDVKDMKYSRNATKEDEKIESVSYKVEFLDVILEKPMTTKFISGQPMPLYPNKARIDNLTYAATLMIKVRITASATMKGTKNVIDKKPYEGLVRAGLIPIMVGSNLCYTSGLTYNDLKKIEEDPTDKGGYFIIKGGEWAIDSLENTALNKLTVHKHMYKSESTRGEFISKPGDDFENSAQIRIRIMKNNAIYTELIIGMNFSINVPFFVIYRLFGMISDKDIVKTIIPDMDNPSNISKSLLSRLQLGFKTLNKGSKQEELIYERNIDKIIEFLSDHYVYQNMTKDSKRYMSFKQQNIIKYFDTRFLPHIGKSADDRIKKLLYYGHLLRRVLLTDMGELPGTDRENYINKRVTPAGGSYAKAFKTQLNFNFVMPLGNSLRKLFMNTSFANINLEDAIQDISPDDLEKGMNQAITCGKSVLYIKNKMTNNRVHSQNIHRKNAINFIATKRTIHTPSSSNKSKQSKRAEDMRAVHATYLLFICPIQSKEGGEKVGMSKEMAISSSITTGTSSKLLTDLLLNHEDMDIININDMTDMNFVGYHKLFINGNWIGCIENNIITLHKLYYLRRNNVINKKTTIYLNELSGDIYLYCDPGRLMCPVLRVYNNIAEYDEAVKNGDENFEFNQWITLTKDHVRKLNKCEITIDDLYDEGVIEYVSPGEVENHLISMSYNNLLEKQHDVRFQYSHCAVEQSILSLTALMSVYANHSPGNRVAFETNHIKQTCGWYALNYPYRIDKNVFFQYNAQMPIVKTMVNNLTVPVGGNCIVAVASFRGYNQEDSLAINQSSVDRGLFAGSFFTFVLIEIEKGEQFGLPNRSITKNIKTNANYEKLEADGFVKVGRIVKKGDVIIGKFVTQPRNSKYKYSDRSYIYNKEEDAIIDKVVKSSNDEGKEFCKVRLRFHRDVAIGDKFSARSGNKGINSITYSSSDMPYTEDGLVPDLILNNAALPTRMVINQPIEMAVSQIACGEGQIYDATAFRPFSIEHINKTLVELGYSFDGTHRMYNGMTGEWIDSDIYIGPTYYQRIQKFIKDNNYAISHGAINPKTGQPVQGASNGGSYKLGEMEQANLIGQGSTRVLLEKFIYHSDGYIWYICRGCGGRVIVNEHKKIYKCKNCRDYADISAVLTSWSAKLFADHLDSSNVNMKYDIEPYTTTEYL